MKFCTILVMFYIITSHLSQPLPRVTTGYNGGAENAGVENAGVEKSGVDSRGGKCRSR